MNEAQLRALLAQTCFHRFLEMRLIEADVAARRVRVEVIAGDGTQVATACGAWLAR